MKRMSSFITVVCGIGLAAGIALSATACSGNGNNAKNVPHADVQKAISQFKQQVPRTAPLFDSAYGYAIFPGVGKGGLVIGGAYGGGEVYRHGELVGHTTITKFDIGPQIGGKTFSEVIFFQNAQAFNHFTGGNFQFSANATAAGGTVGATSNNDYSNGVLVFTMTGGGLMAGANIGGQKFSYTPLSAPAAQTANRAYGSNNGAYGKSGAAYGKNGRAAGAGGASQTMNDQTMNNRNGDNDQAQHRPLKRSDVEATVAQFKQKRPGIGKFFDDAYGYAVFPTIGKGGLIIGGAYGGGAVFHAGNLVGHATVTNFSIGAQIGGKTFSEMIFFQNAKAFNRFTGGNFQFGSNTVSIGVPAGATAAGNSAKPRNAYNDRGIAVFTMTKAGFMAGVNVGGQKFSFTPASRMNNNR